MASTLHTEVAICRISARLSPCPTPSSMTMEALFSLRPPVFVPPGADLDGLEDGGAGIRRAGAGEC